MGNPQPLFSSNPINSALSYIMKRKLIPEYLFTDKHHYLYYKRYIHPKLKVSGERITLKIYGMDHTLERHTYIYVSQSYIVISVIERVTREDGYRNDTYRNYVLGVNDDGKLFSMRVDNIDIDNLPLYPEPDYKPIILHARRGLTVVKSEDRKVLNIVFNITHSNPKDHIVIKEKGAYRIQGDLVMYVKPISEENEENDVKKAYARIMFKDISPLVDYAGRLLFDHIARILVGLGFHIEIENNPLRIYIPHVLSTDHSPMGYTFYRISEVIKNVIRKALEPLEVFNECGGFDVRLERDGYPTGYRSILIHREGFVCFAGSKIVRMLEDELYNELLKVEPKTFEFMMGNHHVKVSNAFSFNIAFTPSIKPLMVRATPIEITPSIAFSERDVYYSYISRNVFLVTPKTTVTVTHESHGIVEITFNDNYIIGFRSIASHEDYALERNRVALSLLLSS